MSAPIYINGRFLGRTVTGVERFAIGLLRALEERAPDGRTLIVLAPPGVERPEWLRTIGFRTVGGRGGHAWEQIDLWRAARGGALVNLCNSGPVLHPRSLVVLHDASVFRHPDQFSRAYRLFHQRLDRLLAKRATLATVSEFSRGELAAILRVRPDAITVIPNAADHVMAIEPDRGIVSRLGLDGRRYLLLVGSFAPNKNMRAAIRAFAKVARPDERLVVVGGAVASFANDALEDVADQVVLAGRVDDAGLVALYGAMRALVFPSLYEGFGIPPLEAMRLGRPVVASAIPSIEEVCGPAARYFDPHDEGSIGAAMRAVFDDDALHAALTTAAAERASLFSWPASAALLQRSMDRL